MCRLFAICLLWTSLLTPPVGAQEWARKMFKVTSHDFGSVARGAKAEFAFELQNIYEEDVHLMSVRSSCGCTEPRITKDTLKTWEKGAVLAVFNTRAFRGARSATLTLTIDKPYYAEVQLSVRGYIRSDVVFEPGVVAFGEVDQGSAPERTVGVSYAGRSSWEIADVRSANEHYEVELLDEQRSGGRVTYKMLVRLKKDAPVGYFQDPLTIVTNDSRNSTLELPVEGHVVSPLTVSPASMFVGVLKPGQQVTKKLVVRGKTPFKIVKIDCKNHAFEFTIPERSAKLHLVPITFRAGTMPGKFSCEIVIHTDLGSGATASCTASGTIVGDEVAKQP